MNTTSVTSLTCLLIGLLIIGLSVYMSIQPGANDFPGDDFEGTENERAALEECSWGALILVGACFFMGGVIGLFRSWRYRKA